ncbi:DUF4167 domain-containing protein [Kordiimonas pumila]|uniref:DUF4167 domain-containing protein n=1 Tax=Kordiimonas pumila TaxID=2161677 RepID=A0ABV7D0U1_9PROT|nr:DUF4167 domain-containing protein [Kordiimonas pumila]
MTQPQNARKQRARPAARKGGGRNSSNGMSNGPGNNRPDNRVRGNPKQSLEKYKNQAREALQSGDRMMAEYYFQFADHYQRVLNEMQGNNRDNDSDNDSDNQNQNHNQHQNQNQNQNQNQGRRGGRNRRNWDNDSSANTDNGNGVAPEQKVAVAKAPDEVKKAETAALAPTPVEKETIAEKPKRQPRAKKVAPVDPAKAEQPAEVHPELDLGATEAVAEKPKRRAPVRRKKPVASDAGTATEAPKDDAAA